MKPCWEKNIKTYICTQFDGFNLKNEFKNVRLIGSLNGPLCPYLMRQNLRSQTRPRDLSIINVFVIFESDARKNADIRALT